MALIWLKEPLGLVIRTSPVGEPCSGLAIMAAPFYARRKPPQLGAKLRATLVSLAGGSQRATRTTLWQFERLRELACARRHGGSWHITARGLEVMQAQESPR